MYLGGFTAFGQGTITGSLMDMDLGGPLPGANVIEAGTNNGVVTDFDGNFSITVAKNQGTLELSYVGYQTKTVSYTLSGETLALGSISVNQAAASLDEGFTGHAGIWGDRKALAMKANGQLIARNALTRKVIRNSLCTPARQLAVVGGIVGIIGMSVDKQLLDIGSAR